MISEEWQKLYAMIPNVGCKKLCQQACGPIGMTEAEYRHIGKNVKAAVKIGDDMWLLPKGKATCPLLVKGRCSVYDNRPMICRLYGATERLKCEHGCKPERYLTEEETRVLLLEAEDLSKREIGNGK